MDNINNPIEITTTGSYKQYKTFLLFTLFKGRFYKIKPFILSSLLLAAIVLYTIKGIDVGMDGFDLYMIGVFSVVLICILIIVFIMPGKNYKRIKSLIEGTVNYRFEPDGFYTQAVSDMSSGSGRMEYDAVTKVYNLDDILVLQLFSRQSFIIYKNTCSPEDIKRINTLFKSKNKKCYDYTKRTK